MKLIAVSHGRNYGSVEREAQVTNQLFRDGLEVFHLRKPLHSVDELRAFLDLIERRFLPRITLHSFQDLVMEYPVGGIHVSEEEHRKFPMNMSQIEFLFRKRPELRQTASFHKLDKLRFAPGKLDYVFLSPVFDSISKPFQTAAFSQEDLLETLSHVKPQVIAAGGFNLNISRSSLNLALLGPLSAEPSGRVEIRTKCFEERSADVSPKGFLVQLREQELLCPAGPAFCDSNCLMPVVAGRHLNVFAEVRYRPRPWYNSFG